MLTFSASNDGRCACLLFLRGQPAENLFARTCGHLCSILCFWQIPCIVKMRLSTAVYLLYMTCKLCCCEAASELPLAEAEQLLSVQVKYAASARGALTCFTEGAYASALVPQGALLYWDLTATFCRSSGMHSDTCKACQSVLRLVHAVGNLLLCLLMYSPICSMSCQVPQGIHKASFGYKPTIAS